MTLTEIKERLQDANLYQIAKATGLSYQTLLNLKKGKLFSCHRKTFETLQRYFMENKNANN